MTSRAKMVIPIYNDTLETLIWSKTWKKSSFFWFEKCLCLRVFPFLFINNECASHFRKWKKTVLIYNSYLLRESFKGYRCELGLPSLHGGSLEIKLTVPLMQAHKGSISFHPLQSQMRDSNFFVNNLKYGVKLLKKFYTPRECLSFCIS